MESGVTVKEGWVVWRGKGREVRTRRAGGDAYVEFLGF